MSPALVGILAALASGGLVGAVATGIVALRKVGPESTNILISGAKELVVLQRSTIEDLRKDLADMAARIDFLEGELKRLRAAGQGLG